MGKQKDKHKIYQKSKVENNNLLYKCYFLNIIREPVFQQAGSWL